MPCLLPVSMLLGGPGAAVSGLIGSYPLTSAFVAVSGVAAYRPESARVARLAGRGSHTAMGWFSPGGNVGFAFVPLLVAAVVGTGGLRLAPLILMPALSRLLFRTLPEPPTPGLPTARPDRPEGLLLEEMDDWGLLFTGFRDSRKGRDLAATPYASAAAVTEAVRAVSPGGPRGRRW